MRKNSNNPEIPFDDSNEESNKFTNKGKGDSEWDAILKKYCHLQITENTAITIPVPVIKIYGETISTEGNVTTVSGPSKSGKTAFVCVVIAGAIAKGVHDSFPGVEISPANDKAIIHIDTEQARHKHQHNLRCILKRAGLEKSPDHFVSFNIRKEPLDKYPIITRDIIQAAYKRFNGIHLIILDGGADYVHDVNDPNESNAMVKFFEELAIDYNAPVIVIIHLNPGSEKERGHLGSQLQRKSESVLTVKMQGDISSLEPKFLRMAGKGNIPLIQFQFDKVKGYHVYCGIKPAEEQSLKEEKRITEIQKIATEIFLPTSVFGYDHALDAIMKFTKKSEPTAKAIFKEMKAHGMIIKDENKKWKNANHFQSV